MKAKLSTSKPPLKEDMRVFIVGWLGREARRERSLAGSIGGQESPLPRAPDADSRPGSVNSEE